MKRYSVLPLLLIVLSGARPASAHFDILLARPASGTQTVIGAAEVDHSEYDAETRIFEVQLGAVAGEFLALQPGVHHPNLNPSVAAYPSAAAGLVPGDVLRLQKRAFSLGGPESELFYWNGFGAVSFAPASAGFRIDSGDPLPGSAGAGGFFDAHPFWVVDSDALPGIYLASVAGQVNGFDWSAPAYLVMGTPGLADLEERLELAADYVYGALVVPEPGAVSLLAVAAGALAGSLRRRNRRS